MIYLPAGGWKPRPYQMPAWEAWERGIKRSLLIWHRRAGKDEVALHKTCCAAFDRTANYWHCLPEYEQARKAIWEAINPHTGRRRIDECFPLEVRKRTDNSTMTIEFTSGSIWKVVGSDNPNSLVGAPPAGIVFSEWALSNPAAWAYLAPILVENNGWADFITTPRGKNHVHNMWKTFNGDEYRKEWFCQRLTIKETGFPAELVEEQRKEYKGIYGTDAADALIDQEFYCSFEAAVLGAIWGRELAELERGGRIKVLPIEKELPIHTAWDLGKGENMAIWVFQVHFNEVRIIDFISGFGIGIEDHVAELERRGYRGGDDWVPHDARIPEIGSQRTRVETLIKLKRKPRVVMRHKVEDGNNAARLTIPHCYFDPRCESGTYSGLEALRQYSYEWDDNRNTFRDTPLKNWCSHAADAFRYLAMAWREIKGEGPPAPDPLKEMVKRKTLSEMIEEYELEQAEE